MKLTRWFAARVKPNLRGWYETEFMGFAVVFRGYSYWDGSRWSNSCDAPRVSGEKWFSGANQSKQWRGLAEKP